MFQLTLNAWSSRTLCSRRVGVYGFTGSEDELRWMLEENKYLLAEDGSYTKIDGDIIVTVTILALAEFPFAAAAIGAM